MDSVRSWMEMFDELKGEMPEGTYLKLCNKAKREFETSKAKPRNYEVTYMNPTGTHGGFVTEETIHGERFQSRLDDELDMELKTIPCRVKNADRYLSLLQSKGCISSTTDFKVTKKTTLTSEFIGDVILRQGYTEIKKKVLHESFFFKLHHVYIVKITPVSDDEDLDSDDEDLDSDDE